MIFDIKPYERRIFELVQDAGSELGYEVYVVGGFVRDRLLGMESKDMDIVCLGSGIRLAEQVASKLSPTPKVVTFNRFGTAMIRHKNT